MVEQPKPSEISNVFGIDHPQHMRTKLAWELNGLIDSMSVWKDNEAAPEPLFHVCKLRRHPEMGIMHSVFPSRPSLLASVFFKISVSAFREVFFPGSIKLSARNFEGLRGAFGVPPMVRRG